MSPLSKGLAVVSTCTPTVLVYLLPLVCLFPSLKTAHFLSNVFFDQVCVLHEISFVSLPASISVGSVDFRNLSVSSKSFFS